MDDKNLVAYPCLNVEHAYRVLCELNVIIQNYGVVRLDELYDLIYLNQEYSRSTLGWTSINDGFVQLKNEKAYLVLSSPEKQSI